MSKAVISNRIYLTYSDSLLEKLKSNLTYVFPPTNPEAQPETVCNVTKIGKRVITIPSGRTDLIPEGWEVINKRVAPGYNFPNMARDIVLREDQQEIYDAVTGDCIINASPGYGKTFVALTIAAKFNLKTLVVTHNVALRQQWEDEYFKMFGERAGIIGSGKKELNEPVVIANVQTLNKVANEVSSNFGLLILDECLDYEVYVTTREGQRKIGALVNAKETPEVLSYNENTKELEWKKVLSHFKNKQEELFIKFTLKDGSTLKCTLNHSIYTPDRGKIPAEEILEGDLILGTKPIKMFETLTSLEVIDIDFVKATGGYRYNIEVEGNHNYLANNKLVANCHHTPATTFKNVIDKSKASIKIGLSATLLRRDKKHIMLPDYFGKIVHKPKDQNRMVPKITMIYTGIELSSNRMVPWATKVNSIANNPVHRDLAIQLASTAIEQGHKTLVFGDRVEWLEYCASLTKNSVAITGGTGDRKALLKRVMTDIDCVYGTTSIFKEGISVDILSCAILCFPISHLNLGMLEQIIGRITREYPGKLQPHVIDVCFKGSTGKRQALGRLNYYKQLNYEVNQVVL